MPEMSAHTTEKSRAIRHRGRLNQIPIYLGKQFRFFVNQSDWKVIPMAAIIAGLVGMVIRKRLFINMEGSLMGAFALTCVALWNGAFNSIQSVCRERPIIKREHRSGMHVTSYVAAHMIYQLFLCLAQTAVSMYVLQIVGIRFPERGFMTRWMIVDIGLSMLLISYASDMMSLFISSFSHTTTSAMTVMPFVLIFQLVFCGSIIPLPEWSRPMANFTISHYGIRAIASQSRYNELPMVTGWNTIEGMKNQEIGGTVSVGQLLDLLNSKGFEKRRDTVVIPSLTAGELADILGAEETSEMNREEKVLDAVTLGQLIDLANGSEILQNRRDQTFSFNATVGEVLEALGEDRVRTFVQTKTAEAGRKPEFEQSRANIQKNWIMLALFAAVFAILSTICLELIDKDKR